MTVAEVVGYAFAEFGRGRFTMTELATFICSIQSARMTVADISAASDLIHLALEGGWVVAMPGPRGGPGFMVTDSGLAATSDVELPLEKFEKRHAAANERANPAEANAGPMFAALYNAMPDNDAEKRFVYSIAEFWMTKKWLSSKQVTKLAEIAKRFDQEIDEARYVGKALDAWTEPFNKSRLEPARQRLEQRKAAELAREAAHREAVRKDREDKAENLRIKGILQGLDAAGALRGLEALVVNVFPTISISAQARTAAFAGTGSNPLRACVAAFAFDAPPDQVWRSRGTFVQPGIDSAFWKTLIAHPAFALKPPPATRLDGAS